MKHAWRQLWYRQVKIAVKHKYFMAFRVCAAYYKYAAFIAIDAFLAGYAIDLAHFSRICGRKQKCSTSMIIFTALIIMIFHRLFGLFNRPSLNDDGDAYGINFIQTIVYFNLAAVVS